MEGAVRWGSQGAPPSYPPFPPPSPRPPLPDSGEAARVALKHIGIVEHRASGVSPSRPQGSSVWLDPDSSGTVFPSTVREK